MDEQTSQLWNDSLGRLAFSAGALALGLFCYRCLHPSGPVMASYLERYSDGWVRRLKYLWSGAAVLLPILFLVLALAGYYYTAVQLMWRLQLSFVLVLVLILLNGLLSAGCS